MVTQRRPEDYLIQANKGREKAFHAAVLKAARGTKNVVSNSYRVGIHQPVVQPVVDAAKHHGGNLNIRLQQAKNWSSSSPEAKALNQKLQENLDARKRERMENASSTDPTLSFWLTIGALLLWVIDRGIGSYKGYQFTAVLQADFLGIIFGGTFTILLYVFWLKDLFTKQQGRMFILLTIFTIIFLKPFITDWVWQVPPDIFGYNTNYILMAAFFGAAIIVPMIPQFRQMGSGMYDIIAAFIFAYFFVNRGWITESPVIFGFIPISLLHFVYILILGLLLLAQDYRTKDSWILWTAMLLVVDTFGYHLTSTAQIAVFSFIPLLTITCLFAIMLLLRSKFAAGAFGVILVLALFAPTPALGDSNVNFEEPAAKTKTISETFRAAVANWFKARMDFAISGKVEEPEAEPAGVYLEEIELSQARVIQGTPISLFGILRAKTFDTPITLDVGCFMGERGEDKIDADNIQPSTSIVVHQLSENVMACTFNNYKGSGTRTVTAEAKFSYSTNTDVDVFFIRQETLDAMRINGQDVYEVYDINRNQIATSSVGPLNIHLGTNPTLIGASDIRPAISIVRFELKNNEGWDGSADVRELILLLPKGASVADPLIECQPSAKWEVYDKEKCIQSCEEELDLCTRHCEGDINCFLGCEERVKVTTTGAASDREGKCADSCELVAGGVDHQFNGYILKSVRNDENEKYVTNDFNDGETIYSCAFTTNPEEVLGTSVYSPKSIQVIARYDYRIEKKKTVRIQKSESADGAGFSPINLNAVGQKVVQIANELGVDTFVARALADKQSNFQHCVDPDNPENKDVVSCSDENVIEGEEDFAYGVMQLNSGEFDIWFSDNHEEECSEFTNRNTVRSCQQLINGLDRSQEFKCDQCRLWKKASCEEGENAYDLDCNIRLGLTLLKDWHDRLVNDDTGYSNIVKSKCNSDDPAVQMYSYNHKQYRGWERAVRAYFGFHCLISSTGVETFTCERTKHRTGNTCLEGPSFDQIDSLSFKGAVHLQWYEPENTNGIQNYVIYRRSLATNDDYHEIARLDVGTENYKDNRDLVDGATYAYKITAERSAEPKASVPSYVAIKKTGTTTSPPSPSTTPSATEDGAP